jgi:hypothetical protein
MRILDFISTVMKGFEGFWIEQCMIELVFVENHLGFWE